MMEWIKLDEKMSIHDANKLGDFLGRYEEVYDGGAGFLLMSKEQVYAIRYYYSHFTKLGRLHTQAFRNESG